jgi:hypothetical protein
MSAISNINENFPHSWHAEILPSRPLILPRRQFVFPAIVEEVERGALEVLVAPVDGEKFLATFALGFRSSSVPTGLWSAPHPDWLCALSGGYAYLVNTQDPTEFTMLELRPALEVLPASEAGLLLFIGSYNIIASGREGLRWTSERLSDEGITAARVDGGKLIACGWELMRDREFEFEIDLQSGEFRKL